MSESTYDSEIGQIKFESGDISTTNSFSIGEIFTGDELISHWENQERYLDDGNSILDQFTVQLTNFETTYGFPGTEIYELVNYSGEGFKEPDNGVLQYIDNGSLVFWEDSPSDTNYSAWYQADDDRIDFSNVHEIVSNSDDDEGAEIASDVFPTWTDFDLFRTVDFRVSPTAESHYVTTHNEFQPGEGNPGILAKLQFTLERSRDIYSDIDPKTHKADINDSRLAQSLKDLTTVGVDDGDALISISGHGATDDILHVLIDKHDPDGYSDEFGTITWQVDNNGDWETINDGPEYHVTEDVEGRSIRAYFQYEDGEGFEEDVVSQEIQYGVDNGDAQISIAGRIVQDEVLHIIIDEDDPDGYKEAEATVKWETKPIDSNGDWSVIGTDHELIVIPDWQGNEIRASVAYVDGDGTPEEVSTDPIRYQSVSGGNYEISEDQNNTSLSELRSNGKDDGDAAYEISRTADLDGVLEVNLISSDPDGDPDSEHINWFSSDSGHEWESMGESLQLEITPDLASKYIRADVSYADGEGHNEIIHTSAILHHVDSYQENVDLVLYEPSAFAYGVGEAIGIRDVNTDVSGNLSVHTPVKGGVSTASAGVTESSVALSEGVAFGGISGGIEKQNIFKSDANMSVISSVETDISSFSEAKTDLEHTMFDADAHSRLGIKDPPIELGFDDLSGAGAGGFGIALMQHVAGGDLHLEATTDFGVTSIADTKLGRGRSVTEAGNVAGIVNTQAYSGDQLELVGIVGADFQTHSSSDHGYAYAQSSLENSAGIQQHFGLEQLLNNFRYSDYYSSGQPLDDNFLQLLYNFIDPRSDKSGQDVYDFLGELDSDVASLLNAIKADAGVSVDFAYEQGSTASDILRDQLNNMWKKFSVDPAFDGDEDELLSFTLSDGQAEALNDVVNSSINPGQTWHGKDVYESGGDISIKAGTDLNAHTTSSIIGDGEADIFESDHQILYDDYSIAQTYMGESAGIVSDQLGGLIIKAADRLDVNIANKVDVDTDSNAVLGNSMAASEIFSSTGVHNVYFDSGSNGVVDAQSITDMKSFSHTIVGSSDSYARADDTKGIGSVGFFFPGQDANINSEARTTLHSRSISTHGTSNADLSLSVMGIDGSNYDSDFKGHVEGASEVNAIVSSQGFSESAAVQGGQSGLGDSVHSSSQQALFGVKDYLFDSNSALELTSSVDAESRAASVMGTTTV